MNTVGSGIAKITIEITRPDGQVEHLSIHGVELDVDECVFVVRDDDDPYYIKRIPTNFLRTPDRILGLQIVGKLRPDENGQLYTVVHSPIAGEPT